MHPELFEIPFVHLTVYSYGAMMVVGFLAAIYLIKRLSRSITPDAQLIINAALYSLIAGVIGARVFYVVHYFDKFRSNLLSVFAIWQGGLELLGGVLLAIIVIAGYLRYHKLAVRRYLDILAVGLMLALCLGRVGCFLNGCCFGKPTNLPWAVRFPYGSQAYLNQVSSNLQRNRPEPQLKIPTDYFTSVEEQGSWYSVLKPYDDLTPEQKFMVDRGPYRSLPVHPTQLYSAANGAFLCVLLFFFWRRTEKTTNKDNSNGFLRKPGCVFGMMFVLYGVTRFLIEFVRDDNPFNKVTGLTVSQNIGIVMVVLGVILVGIFAKMKPKAFEKTLPNKRRLA